MHMYPPPVKQSSKRFILPASLLVGGMILGGAMASANKPDPVTIEKQVPGPERVVEKKVEVKVPVTPAACLEALDINEQAFTQLATSLEYISNQDYVSAKESNAKVTALVPKSNAAKAECRASK